MQTNIYALGKGYYGSSDLETSVALLDIIPKRSDNVTPISFYMFSFNNDSACHISFNGGSTWIYLKKGQGFSTSLPNKEINSFMIQENGITYNWIGAW